MAARSKPEWRRMLSKCDALVQHPKLHDQSPGIEAIDRALRQVTSNAGPYWKCRALGKLVCALRRAVADSGGIAYHEALAEAERVAEAFLQSTLLEAPSRGEIDGNHDALGALLARADLARDSAGRREALEKALALACRAHPRVDSAAEILEAMANDAGHGSEQVELLVRAESMLRGTRSPTEKVLRARLLVRIARAVAAGVPLARTRGSGEPADPLGHALRLTDEALELLRCSANAMLALFVEQEAHTCAIEIEARRLIEAPPDRISQRQADAPLVQRVRESTARLVNGQPRKQLLASLTDVERRLSAAGLGAAAAAIRVELESTRESPGDGPN